MAYPKNKIGHQFHGRSSANYDKPHSSAEKEAVKLWGKYVRIGTDIVLTKDYLHKINQFELI
jgi:hypothetical protein